MEVKNFDDLSRLWREDPEAAEAYHRAVIEDFILGLPEEKQDQARRIQWRIDQGAAKFTDPKQRLNWVFLQMWDSFLSLNNSLNYPIPRKPKKTAVVLEIKK